MGPAHPGKTCNDRIRELQEKEEEQRRFAEWKRENARADEAMEELRAREGWKGCSNCNVLIERTRGCDHMTCSNCGCHFCYICGKYSKENPRSRGDCGMTCKNK